MAAIINLTGWNNPDVWICSIILKSKRFNQFWDGSSHRFDVWTPIFDGQLPICYTNQSVSPNASGCYTMISLFWSSRSTSLAQPVGLPGKSREIQGKIDVLVLHFPSKYMMYMYMIHMTRVFLILGVPSDITQLAFHSFSHSMAHVTQVLPSGSCCHVDLACRVTQWGFSQPPAPLRPLKKRAWASPLLFIITWVMIRL